MPANVTKITRDIAPGEVFTHNGSVELSGNIGTGAQVQIDKGGILVKGDVADKVKITTKNSGGSVSISGRGGNITISGSDVVIVNGKVISGGGNNGGISGISIEGQTGNSVTYFTDSSISLAGDAEDNLVINADGSATLADTGAGLEAVVDGSFRAARVGPKADIRADGSANVDELGENSKLTTDGSVRIAAIGAYAEVRADGSGTVGKIGPHAKLVTDGSARVDTAHDTAKVKADGSKRIGRTSSDDGEFKLSKSFTETAQKPAAQEETPEGDAPSGNKPKRGFNL